MKLFEIWKEVMFNPNNFFEKLPSKDRYKAANHFFLSIQAINIALTFIFLIPFLILFGFFSSLEPLGGSLSIGFVGIILLIMLLAFPFILLFSWGMLYVGAAIVHLFAMLLGAKKTYLETFKANAYAIAPSIFSFIPFVSYAAGIYSLVLLAIGLHKRQEMSIGRAAAAILIPLAIFFMLILFAFFLFFAALIATTITY